MIRFVDLTPFYWSDPEDRTPTCGFLDTVTDRFIDADGSHTFDSLDGVRAIPELGERCVALVPHAFFEHGGVSERGWLQRLGEEQMSALRGAGYITAPPYSVREREKEE